MIDKTWILCYIIVCYMKTNFEQTDTPYVWGAQSNEQGPTVTILGGVHGDEKTGIHIVNSLVEQGVDIEAGTVYVALGNVAAMQCVDGPKRHTGVNMNRVFRDLNDEEKKLDPAQFPYELLRTQELNKVLGSSDGLLDLHDFSDPNGPIFLISDLGNGLKVATAIGAPVISTGWDILQPGGSDGYMARLGRVGLCYELGHKDKPRANAARGFGAADRFLQQMGLKEITDEPLDAGTEPRFIHVDSQHIRQGNKFNLAGGFRTFQQVAPNQLIATDDGHEIRARHEGQIIVFPEVPPIGEEAFILGHEYDPKTGPRIQAA